MPVRPRRYMNPVRVKLVRFIELRDVYYDPSRMIGINPSEKRLLDWYFSPERSVPPIRCQNEEEFLQKCSESEIEGIKAQLGNLLYRINLNVAPARKR